MNVYQEIHIQKSTQNNFLLHIQKVQSPNFKSILIFL